MKVVTCTTQVMGRSI